MSRLSTPASSVFLVVFVFSGLAGLIYQSIWSHYLGLFLGHAAYAQALVLALFMGGMALGAALVGRFGSGWSNLLRMYAGVEAVVGVFGLTFHVVFVAFLDFSYDTAMPALGGGALVSAYKWIWAGLLILPQTVLLGMTFPLMSGAVIRRFPGSDGHSLGGLYFANSIGAACGVLIATFALLPNYGLPGAVVAAGLINMGVAAVAWWLARKEEAPPAPRSATAAASAGSTRPLLRMVVIATLLSSAASFAYELLFVRMLGLAVGSTLHAFELMLAAFVAGIALGARWIRRRADRADSPLRLAGYLQILMGLTALIGLALYGNAFHWVSWLIDALGRSDGGYALYNLGTAVISIAIMLPTAFFVGTTLPLYTVALLRAGEGEGAIGRVYAWNTLGAILGVFVCIHFLLPVLGLKLGMTVAATLDIAIGIALFRYLAGEHSDRLRLGVSVATMLIAVFVALNLLEFDPKSLSSGVYRSGDPRLSDDTQMLFYKDGKTATVSLFRSPGGRVSIANNGKVDAGIQMNPGRPPTPDEPTMVLLAALPLAYRPAAERAAVIGLGSGLSTHTLLADSSLDQVDTIEIEQAMASAARGFGERVARVYEDPRSKLVIDDAKSYFAGNRKEYDIIVSEPSNPWMSGVGNLFSREFYQFVPRYLTDEGIFVQWLQLYSINETLVSSALQGLLEEFNHVHGYMANSADLLLLASQTPFPAKLDKELMFETPVWRELNKVGIDDIRQLTYRKIADTQLLQALVRLYPGPVNSDYFPLLTLEAPKTRFKRINAERLSALSVLNAPMLEWIGVRGPVADAAWVAQPSHFPGETTASHAVALRDMILKGSSRFDAPESVRTLAVQLDAAGNALCNENAAPHELSTAARAVRALTDRTLARLDSKLLDGLLIDPDWLKCATPVHSEFRAVLELLEAAASRDATAMVQQGRVWLSGRDNRAEWFATFDPVALATLQFGLIGSGRGDEVQAAEAKFGEDLAAEGDYGYTRSLLLAWLDNGKARAGGVVW